MRPLFHNLVKTVSMSVNKKQTSKEVASKASVLLRVSKDKNVKSVAASDLAQAPKKKVFIRVKK